MVSQKVQRAAGAGSFLYTMACVTHTASAEIKDIQFLLPYLKEKFTDKEVSTLMIKPHLDLHTWVRALQPAGQD